MNLRPTGISRHCIGVSNWEPSRDYDGEYGGGKRVSTQKADRTVTVEEKGLHSGTR